MFSRRTKAAEDTEPIGLFADEQASLHSCVPFNVWHTYGMQKTTVYLPEDLRRNLARAARLAKTSEASLIREAVKERVDSLIAKVPRLPLFHSKHARLAENADAALKGFGER